MLVKRADLDELAHAFGQKRRILIRDVLEEAFANRLYRRIATWPDFGGQLQFVDKCGAVEEVFVPGFNTLSLFAVPHPHAVSAVAPYVATHRYAIT